MANWFSKNNLLIFLLAITFLKGAVWAAAVPLFQAPDEQYHYATVQWYAIPKGHFQQPQDFPLKKVRNEDIVTQNLSPELRSFLEKTDFDRIRWKPDNQMSFVPNSSFGNGEKDLQSANLSRFIQRFPPWYVSYGPDYYKAMAFIENALGDKSIMERVFAIRLFSVFLGTLLVVCAYFVFRNLFLDKTESAILAGIVSFQPAFTFVESSINIDPLLFLSFALFVLGSVRILRNMIDKWSVLFVLGGMVVGIHAKQPGYFMLAALPVLIFFYFWLWQRQKIAPLWQKSKVLTVVIPLAVIFAVVFLALQRIFGYIGTTIRLIPKYILYELQYVPTFERTLSYWGNFGWVDTHLARFFIFAIWLGLILSAAGIVKYFFKYFRRPAEGNEKIFFFQLLYFLFFVVGVGAMIHFVNLQYANPNNVADQSQSIGLQGRYFFPAIIPKMALVAFGLAFLFSKINRRWIFLALLAGMIFLNLWSLFDLVIPRYYL